MKEIRLHGRGGQGAVSAADLLAVAAVMEGHYGSSFPMYGAERRGAPVVAFVCVDEKPIRQKTQIYKPNCLIVLDPRQGAWPQTYEGVQPGSTLVLNSTIEPDKPPHENVSVSAVVDATRIALEEIGIPAFSTCMLGAVAATTGWVKLESLFAALEKTFSGDLLKKNIRSVELGYKDVNIYRW